MLPIKEIVEMLKEAWNFSNNIVKTFDEEKYARAVIEIYGHEPNYNELDILAKVIENATDISTKEKMDLLFAISDKRNELREKEFKLKNESAKTVDRGTKKKLKNIAKFALHIASGGLTLIPDLYFTGRNGKHDGLIIESKSKD